MRQWSFRDLEIDWLIGKPLTFRRLDVSHYDQRSLLMNFGDLRPPNVRIMDFNFPEKALELYNPVDLFQEHYL